MRNRQGPAKDGGWKERDVRLVGDALGFGNLKWQQCAEVLTTESDLRGRACPDSEDLPPASWHAGADCGPGIWHR